jgi:hypothetical protein
MIKAKTFTIAAVGRNYRQSYGHAFFAALSDRFFLHTVEEFGRLKATRKPGDDRAIVATVLHAIMLAAEQGVDKHGPLQLLVPEDILEEPDR